MAKCKYRETCRIGAQTTRTFRLIASVWFFPGPDTKKGRWLGGRNLLIWELERNQGPKRGENKLTRFFRANAAKDWKGKEINKFFLGRKINKFFLGRKMNKFFPGHKDQTSKRREKVVFFGLWYEQKREQQMALLHTLQNQGWNLIFKVLIKCVSFLTIWNVFLWFC